MPDDFPPAPWRLQGQMHLSAWWVPRQRLQVSLEPAFELLTVAGRACVVTGFVDYQAGSVLTYRELFGAVSVRVRGSRRRGMSVVRMWVDSRPSLLAGRALWGMPKELARFSFDPAPGDAAFAGAGWDPDGGELASARFQALASIGWRARLPRTLPILQVLHGRVHTLPSHLRFSPTLLRAAEWIIPASSPLAALGVVGRRPWLSVQARDFDWELPEAVPLEPAGP